MRSRLMLATFLAVSLPLAAGAAPVQPGVLVAAAAKKDKDDDKPKKPSTPKPASAKPKKKSNAPKPPPRMLPKMALGLMGGANIANIAGDNTDNLDSKIGFDASFVFIYEVINFFHFQTGLTYATKGATSESSTDEGNNKRTITNTFTYSYVELPLLARLVYPKGKIKPYLLLGIYAAFLASSDIEVENKLERADGSSETNTTNNEDKDASSFDAGIKAALGVEYRVSRGFSVMLEGGYQRGLTDISSAKNADGNNDNQVHSDIQINAGVLFRF